MGLPGWGSSGADVDEQDFHMRREREPQRNTSICKYVYVLYIHTYIHRMNESYTDREMTGDCLPMEKRRGKEKEQNDDEDARENCLTMQASRINQAQRYCIVLRVLCIERRPVSSTLFSRFPPRLAAYDVHTYNTSILSSSLVQSRRI